jgi:hypothetical protein
MESCGAESPIFQLAVCVRENLNIFHPKFVGRWKFTPDLPSTSRTCPPLADKRHFRLDNFKLFVQLLAELRALLGLAAVIFI